MVSVLERSTVKNAGPQRDSAQAIAALCVGAMVSRGLQLTAGMRMKCATPA